ncbi:hypothetical protein CLOSTMETH_01116 [[Clostridium] methylpentosum DSM 5476]|uniref:Uncharacterized protein n=1 Tax=[Clostridium] methylpentosum DSM 5476 TaxID=537013 RepID=C0EB98_9FIRM|nr:hypothetical protein CLOSTMETH_01116 [[Clostridium] methylpentosum DSM 5476]
MKKVIDNSQSWCYNEDTENNPNDFRKGVTPMDSSEKPVSMSQLNRCSHTTGDLNL